MELLKEVAKDRLVVMVTHNPELAEQRCIRDRSRVEIRSLIEARKADGKTVIITSHDLSEIEKCADDVSMIKNGRLLFDKGCLLYTSRCV